MADIKTVTVEFDVDTKGLEAAAKKSDEVFDKVNAGAKSAGANTKKFTDETTSGVAQVTEGFGKLGIAIGAAAIIGGLNKIISKSLEMAGHFEKTKVAFKSLLGSSVAAEKFAASLNKFSKGTILDPQNINEAAKALLAFGIAQDKIESNLQSIGDISAATGKNFNELAVIFGKAKTQGVLFAEDINQLTEAGIPVIQEFAKILGVEADQVKKLGSQGKISFDVLEKAFDNMTSAGGRFFGFMKDQTTTYEGQIQKMGVATDSIFRNLGEHWIHLGENFRDEITDMANSIAKWLEIPVSEKMEEQALKVDVLVGRITDLNTTEADRKVLIEELNQVYPEFFKNLDKDAATNEQITQRYKEVNEQLINRIVLQKEEEKVQEAADDAAEARSEMLETEIELRRLLIKVNKEYDLGINLNNGSLKENRLAVVKALGEIGVHLPELARLNAELMRDQEDVTEATQESNDALRQKAEIMKMLGITMEDLSKKEIASPTVKGPSDKDQKEAQKAAEKLRIEQAKAESDFQKKLHDAEETDLEIKEAREKEALKNEEDRLEQERLMKQKAYDDNLAALKLAYEQEVAMKAAFTLAKEDLDRRVAVSAGQAAVDILNAAGMSQEAMLAQLLFSKTMAAADVFINLQTETAKLAALYPGPPSIPLILAARIRAGLSLASIVATTVSGVTAINKQAVQKHAKGTDLVRGPGTATSDSVHAMLSAGEAVVQADMNMKHNDAIKAIRRDKFHDYVMKQYLPAAGASSGGVVTVTPLNDGNIVYQLRQSNKHTKEQTELLATIAKNSDRSYYDSRYK